MASRIRKLFVGNLPWTISSRELKDYFCKFGGVRSAKVIFNKQTGFSKGIGFVEYVDTPSYTNCTKESTHFLEGHYIVVRPSRLEKGD